MSNIHIQRTYALNQKLKELNKIIKDKEYLAAGITIEISVGANDTDPFTVDLGLTSDLEAIMLAIQCAIIDARTARHRWAKEEQDELNIYFSQVVVP